MHSIHGVYGSKTFIFADCSITAYIYHFVCNSWVLTLKSNEEKECLESSIFKEFLWQHWLSFIFNFSFSCEDLEWKFNINLVYSHGQVKCHRSSMFHKPLYMSCNACIELSMILMLRDAGTISKNDLRPNSAGYLFLPLSYLYNVSRTMYHFWLDSLYHFSSSW